jgi:predicted nuclease with TOPRIM domain
MKLSLSEAAKRAGISKSKAHRAIKSGLLSATREDDGTYSIDLAELRRAFPKEMTETPRETTGETKRNADETGEMAKLLAELAELRVTARLLGQQLEREKDTVDDLRKRLDRAEDRLLLTDQRKGFLGRLFNK